MRPVHLAILLALFTACCVAGCGKKGALYLPDEPAKPVPARSSPAPTP